MERFVRYVPHGIIQCSLLYILLVLYMLHIEYEAAQHIALRYSRSALADVRAWIAKAEHFSVLEQL